MMFMLQIIILHALHLGIFYVKNKNKKCCANLVKSRVCYLRFITEMTTAFGFRIAYHGSLSRSGQ